MLQLTRHLQCLHHQLPLQAQCSILGRLLAMAQRQVDRPCLIASGCAGVFVFADWSESCFESPQGSRSQVVLNPTMADADPVLPAGQCTHPCRMVSKNRHHSPTPTASPDLVLKQGHRNFCVLAVKYLQKEKKKRCQTVSDCHISSTSYQQGQNRTNIL